MWGPNRLFYFRGRHYDKYRFTKKYKIVVVPTILILDDGEEVARFQANIMMTMEATREEVQESIDEIIMSKF